MKGRKQEVRRGTRASVYLRSRKKKKKQKEKGSVKKERMNILGKDLGFFLARILPM